jgi:hypothetical protein
MEAEDGSRGRQAWVDTAVFTFAEKKFLSKAAPPGAYCYSIKLSNFVIIHETASHEFLSYLGRLFLMKLEILIWFHASY